MKELKIPIVIDYIFKVEVIEKNCKMCTKYKITATEGEYEGS